MSTISASPVTSLTSAATQVSSTRVYPSSQVTEDITSYSVYSSNYSYSSGVSTISGWETSVTTAEPSSSTAISRHCPSTKT